MDRDLRLGLGAVAMYLAVFVTPGPWSFAVGAVALVLLVTGLVGFCPLYAIFGHTTCSVPEQGERR